MRTKSEVNADLAYIETQITTHFDDKQTREALEEARIALENELIVVEENKLARRQARAAEINTTRTKLNTVLSDPQVSSAIKATLRDELDKLAAEEDVLDVRTVSR